jgi:hypothetical protein
MILEQVKDVNTVEQFIAVMDFLEAMGYNKDKLTIAEVFDLRRNMINVVEVFNSSQS